MSDTFEDFGHGLPPYQAGAKCRKCGWDHVNTQYLPSVENSPLWARNPSVRRAFDAEHMVRRCGRCGFQWHEAPLS